MRTPTTVKGVLRAARRILSDRKAWCQDLLHTYNPCSKRDQFCSMGAVYKAASGNPRRATPLADRAKQQLERVLPEGYTYITEYNDKAGRRHRDVLALFDKAIKLK